MTTCTTTPAGRPRRHATVSLLVALAGLLAGTIAGTIAGTAGTRADAHVVTAAADVPSMHVGAKNFAGAEVLSQVYGQALAARGARIELVPGVGPTETIFGQLLAGDLDAYGEYQGTLLEFLGGSPSHDTTRTHARLAARVRGEGLVVSNPAPAVDVNGFYVLRRTATKHQLTTVSDLAKIAPKLTFGGPPECLERPLCLGPASQRIYGLDFRRVHKLDAGGPETRRALVSGRVDVALLFTGSSVIPRNAVLLRDDKGLQPADNPVLVLRREVATPEVLSVVNAVSARITTNAYRRMALDVSVRSRDPSDVAARFLAEQGLP